MYSTHGFLNMQTPAPLNISQIGLHIHILIRLMIMLIMMVMIILQVIRPLLLLLLQ